MLVCPQTGFARRPRGEEACTNAHKRREEPYFRRGARASCLPRGSKGHKREVLLGSLSTAQGQVRKRGEGALLCPVLLRACMDASRAFAPAHTRAGDAGDARRARAPPAAAGGTDERGRARAPRAFCTGHACLP